MNFINEKILRRKFRTKVFRFYPPGLRITNDGLYKRELSDDGITNSDSNRMWTFKKFTKLIFGFFLAALITGLAVLMILLIIKSSFKIA
ncbi:hypothetical protein BpHYR1_050613 [Brachionus plicatilis]|uniref:Uncharacterized protein n=1 Tax=Brachionus plicatilis TaxID=10195 RepID=A0A3M7PUW1_BRAPC|nr:hypothetical protein BpHYR1_050613 [Brachionus plicatilis]